MAVSATIYENVNDKNAENKDKVLLPVAEDYAQIMAEVEEKIGERPKMPSDLPKGNWSEQALKVLRERYLDKDKDGVIKETPEEMVWRVAFAIASAEARFGLNKDQVVERAKSFYRLLTSLKFLPNSPTLMNAGKGNGLQYSACFVLPVEDSMVGIFDAIKWQAIIHQSGGGTGFGFSRLRPQGSFVKTSRGVASGPVSFMKIFDAATQQVKQGGTRRGANMGMLSVDHPDVREFITCKLDGGITNFNISVLATDKFMEALKNDEEYELIAPHSGEVVGREKAREIFDLMCESAWKSGDPGMVFVDRVNASKANPVPTLGPIESTNPCVTGETLVSTSDGLKRVKDLVGRKDIKVLVDGRLGDNTYEQAVQIIETGEKEVYKLETREGYTLRLTGDHRVMTSDGWKEADKLVDGDRLYLSNRKGGFGAEGSHDWGQVLGWLVGDGTFNGLEAVLSFFGEEKHELAEKFAYMVNQLTEGEQKLNRSYQTGVVEIEDRDEARVSSTRLARMVKSFGLERGEKLKVPEVVLTGSEEMQKGFLSALFTADGQVSGTLEKGVSVRLTSISLPLLKEVQRLLLNFGIVSKIYQERRPEMDRMMPNGKGGNSLYHTKAQHDLVISKNNLWRFAEEIAFLTEAKNAALIKRLKTFKRGPYLEKFEARFVSLSYEGIEKVYDLTEPSTHSFIANGLVVHNCGEQPLYGFDACNLGSIFLTYFVKEGASGPEVDWDELRRVTHESVRFLDDVIEVNPYPLPQIWQTVRNIRRIGLGIGGWADMLFKLGIPYDSKEAYDLGAKIMEFIGTEGHLASERLAEKRGPFPLFDKSIYKDGKPLRNSTVTTIAPTGTISIIAGASSGIEPIFALAYRHTVKDEHINRELVFVNPVFKEIAKQKGWWSEDFENKVAEKGSVHGLNEVPEQWQKVFVTSHEIKPTDHVRMQAAWQKNTDNAVSKTINLPNDATVNDVATAYLQAWSEGCMGITVYRDGSKGWQVLNVGSKTDKKTDDKGMVIETLTDPKEIEAEVAELRLRPKKLTGSTYQVKTPVGTAFVVINSDDLGNPFEVFVNVGKAGTHVTADAEAIGRLVSLSLRVPSALPAKAVAEAVVEQLAGIGGAESIGFGNGKVRSLADGVAKVLREHLTTELALPKTNGHAKNSPLQAELDSGVGMQPESLQVSLDAQQEALPLTKGRRDLCPDCGQATMVLEEGCSKCYSCGASKC